MNESQIIAWLKTYVYAAPEVQLEMISGMAQRFDGLHKRVAELEAWNSSLSAQIRSTYSKRGERIAELEKQVAEQNEMIGQLREEYQKLMVNWAGAVQLQDEYKAQVAELTAEREKDIALAQAGNMLMQARIAELEAENVQLRAGASEMENEIEQDDALVAELETQQWPPRSTAIVSEYEVALRPGESQKEETERLVRVDEDEDLRDPINSIDIQTMYSGTAFLLDCIEEPIHLPAGYYIAKVQPPAETQP